MNLHGKRGILQGARETAGPKNPVGAEVRGKSRRSTGESALVKETAEEMFSSHKENGTQVEKRKRYGV